MSLRYSNTLSYGVGNPISCSLMDNDGEIDYTIWYLFSVNGVFVGFDS